MASIAVSPTTMERVDAGFEWAEENLPDWREFVDPAKLDLASATNCFLGQYWLGKYPGNGAFWTAASVLFREDWDRLKELGFVNDGMTNRELTAAWRQKFEEMYRNDEEAQG